ncbi:hypothetical protein NA56DRAFT_696044 [Hyaloscypha hepaticicola]|uniref:Uncharacterized protein n=1 Tax=Hyaloscypha hepaticicola TaxID=2082293 RepID=A0A2J6QPU4_9HELO|nr:hypothetical protein NA56DRAFT_696044 [Hyaloscypha hepaticicola]
MSLGNVEERRGSNKPGSELPAPPQWISIGNLELGATRKDPAATRSNTSRRLFEERWRCRNTVEPGFSGKESTQHWPTWYNGQWAWTRRDEDLNLESSTRLSSLAADDGFGDLKSSRTTEDRLLLTFLHLAHTRCARHAISFLHYTLIHGCHSVVSRIGFEYRGAGTACKVSRRIACSSLRYSPSTARLTLAAWSFSHWLSLGTASQAHDGCIDCQTTDGRPAVYNPYYEQSYAESTSVLSFMLIQPPWLPTRISGSSTHLA